MNLLLAGQLAFIREYECKTDDEKKAMLEAIEVVQDAQKREEINQSLLYENERLLKSVQEIKAEIEQHRKKCASIDKYDLLGDALSIINRHMSWEGEEEEQKERQRVDNDAMDAYKLDYDDYDIECCQ